MARLLPPAGPHRPPDPRHPRTLTDQEASATRQHERHQPARDLALSALRAGRAYTFPGGCVTQRFRGAAPSAFRMSDTASTEVGFITREELGQALERRSHGRLQLDP